MYLVALHVGNVQSLVKIPEVGMTDGKSGVISSIFSGTSTLITASDNGQVN